MEDEISLRSKGKSFQEVWALKKNDLERQDALNLFELREQTKLIVSKCVDLRRVDPEKNDR